MSRRKENGFTLIELVMVITIMAVLLGAVVPSFNHVLGGKPIQSAATTLSNMIRYARSVAVTRSMMTKMSFDPEKGTIVLSVEEDPINNTGTFVTEPFPVAYEQDFPKDVKVQKIDKSALSGSLMENEITFNPDGSSTDTLIYLVDATEKIYTIGVVGLTGQVLTWDHMVENFYAP